MFNALRESAHGVFGRMLLALLVLSFGIWGIGDIFRQAGGGGASAIAKVGKIPITVSDYRRALHDREQELQIKFGKDYSPALFRKLGLDVMVRDELINNRLVAAEADAQGIAISDDEIIKVISHNPTFQDKDGNFDKATYLAALRSNGIGEQRYVEDLRRTLAAGLLADTVTSNIIVPDALLQAVYKSQEERRAANILLISPSVLKQVPVPTEQEIKSYYDAHSNQFLTPEYRSISYVDMQLADVQKKIEIPEEEIKRAYDERAQDLHRPERRQVDQMIFEKETDAQKAADRLKHGEHFTEVAKTANLLNKAKISLGLIAKGDLPAEDADAVFALKENMATQPLKSDFGWHIFYVGKIVPEGTETLAEARPEIVKDLSTTKANETLSRLSNQIEDDMAGGTSLEDAVKKNGFRMESVKQVAHDGKMADGKEAPFPHYDNFLDTAFSTSEKEHSQAVQTQDGSFFIVRVDSVTPQHAKPLAEVKDRIIPALKEKKTAELLEKEAGDIDDKLRAGKKPEAALAGIASGNIKRDSSMTEGGKPLPRKLVEEIFTLQPQGFTHAYKAPNGDYMIASLEKIIPAPDKGDPKLLNALRDSLKSELQDEVMSHYLIYLRGKHSVWINEAAFRPRENEGNE